MTRFAIMVVALAACSSPAVGNKALSNATNEPAQIETFRMTLAGVGPLGRGTDATEAGLRAALPNYTVKTHDLGPESGIVFDVFDGDDKLFYVVPDEGERGEAGEHNYENTIFSVFATTPRVTVEGYSWRVGYPLDSVKDLMGCECWGSGAEEVTACYIRAHLTVIFEEHCRVAREGGPEAMIGHKIGRIMWKRVAND